MWAVPRIASFFAAALADHLIDRIGDRLQPEWVADMEDALEQAVEPIRREVTLNGGGSMKDLVVQMQRDLEPLLIELRSN